MRVEKDLQKLEEEINALKSFFQQSATTLSLVSYNSTITTTSREYVVSNASYFNPLQWQPLFRYLKEGGTIYEGPYFADEVIRVTFRSDSGSNTLAHLEIDDLSSGGGNVRQIKRVSFSGGARWVINCEPNVSLVGGVGLEYRWSPTILKITVRSIMPGTLEVVQL